MKRDSLPVAPPSKEELRRIMRARLREIDPARRAEASLLICHAAAHLPEFKRARCVALFSPLASEPDVRLLVEEAWAEGKRVAFPLMIPHKNGPELDWHEVANWEELVVPGPFGLREPDPLRAPRISLAELECAFIPGLAFEKHGLRLGRGGGFYDYFLSRTPASLPHFGLMFACQQAETIPHEPHDQKLQALLTETQTWRFKAGKA